MKNDKQKDRRDFLKSLAGLTAGIMVPGACQASGETKSADAKGPMVGVEPQTRDRLGELLPQRKFGKTGIYVTMLGLGGAHISRMDEKEAEKTIETALEGGIRFFDNAESYGNGRGEERYGALLCPKYRDVAYVMTKSTETTARGVQEHLEGSLRRLKTDYIDLWQIHSIRSPEDVDSRIKEGVLKFVMNAQETGKVRHIGFTGHTDFNGHKRMLASTDALQTCQMPINAFDSNYKSFITNVMPTLVEQDYGIIAMKTLSNGGFFGGTSHFNHGDNPRIVPDVLSIQEALHFVWSLPVSVLVTGADNAEMLTEKINLAKSFVAFSDAQREEIIDRVAGFQGNLVEYYKA